jgi:hypothetical protein
MMDKQETIKLPNPMDFAEMEEHFDHAIRLVALNYSLKSGDGIKEGLGDVDSPHIDDIITYLDATEKTLDAMFAHGFSLQVLDNLAKGQKSQEIILPGIGGKTVGVTVIVNFIEDAEVTDGKNEG